MKGTREDFAERQGKAVKDPYTYHGSEQMS